MFNTGLTYFNILVAFIFIFSIVSMSLILVLFNLVYSSMQTSKSVSKNSKSMTLNDINGTMPNLNY